jgi:hypothetical protein
MRFLNDATHRTCSHRKVSPSKMWSILAQRLAEGKRRVEEILWEKVNGERFIFLARSRRTAQRLGSENYLPSGRCLSFFEKPRNDESEFRERRACQRLHPVHFRRGRHDPQNGDAPRRSRSRKDESIERLKLFTRLTIKKTLWRRPHCRQRRERRIQLGWAREMARDTCE